MPIWYVNPKRRKNSRTGQLRKQLAAIKARRQGQQAIASRTHARRAAATRAARMPTPFFNPKKKRRAKPRHVKVTRKMPPGLRRYWQAQNKKHRKPRRAAARKRRRNTGLTYVMNPRRARPKKRRHKSMARYTKKRRRRAAKKAWATRRTKYKSRRRGALRGWRKRRGGKRRRPRYSAKRGFAMSVRRKRRRRGTSRRRRRAGRRRTRGYSRARRRRAAKKGWVTRRSRRRSYSGLSRSRREMMARLNPRRRRRRRKYRRNPSRRRYGRRRYRRNPIRRRHGRRRMRRNARRRRGAIRSFRLRRNPIGGILGGLKDAAMAALPVVGAMVGGNLIVNNLAGRVPGAAALGRHLGPVSHAAMIVAGGWASHKFSFLQKHRHGIMIGLGVNLIRSLLQTYAPDSVKAALGAADGIYDRALTGYGAMYQEMGDYIETGAMEELGEYVETGAEEELGEYVETGAVEELGDTSQGGAMMLAPAKQVSMVQAIPHKSFTRQVPAWSPGFDASTKLYSGIFSGGWG